MCLLALFYRVAEDAPVVVGALREEVYARGGEPPHLLDGPLRAVAGTDPVAGGTWLGVNERSVLVAVTNRRKSQPPAQPRSRGLLVRELLTSCVSAAEVARQAAQELSRDEYDGCNLLCADAASATVLHAGDWLRVRPLPPGLHVLTNRDVNDATDRRLAHALSWLERQPSRSAAECLSTLRKLCSGNDPSAPPMCLHGKDRGTVSSSLIALPASLAAGVYLHAQGPPDHAPYTDCSGLLRRLAAISQEEAGDSAVDRGIIFPS
jgi:uncharacterized protein with NRDE domain